MRIDVLGDVWHRSKKALTLLLRSKATTNWRKEGGGNKIFGENRHAAYNHKGYSQIQSTGREGEGRIWESEARAATPGSPAATTRTAPFPAGSGEFRPLALRSPWDWIGEERHACMVTKLNKNNAHEQRITEPQTKVSTLCVLVILRA